jgi:uncharacterized membrane protein
MSIREWPPVPDISFNEADRLIIESLREGRNVPSNLADEHGYTRQYVSRRLKRLREHGIVKNIGNGVYELVAEDLDEQ